MLGSCWDHFGIILGSFWDQFGIMLGQFWDYFGITNQNKTLQKNGKAPYHPRPPPHTQVMVRPRGTGPSPLNDPKMISKSCQNDPKVIPK